MKRKYIGILIGLIISGVFLFNHGGCSTGDTKNNSALEKAIAEAGRKASEEISAYIDSPAFMVHVQSHVADMPAIKERPVIWKYLTSKRFIKEMRFIAADRLLVNYSLSFPILVDTSSGKRLWEFKPKGWKIGSYDIVAAFSDLILIRENVDDKNAVVLAAIDATSGEQLWYTIYKGKKKLFHFLPSPFASVVLVAELWKNKVRISAVDLFTGKEKWRKTFNVGRGGHPAPPMINAGQIWHFYGQVTKMDAATGKVVWQKKEIALGNLSPPPVFRDGKLYLIDGKKNLAVLASDTGKIMRVSQQNPKVRYTNIYPSKKRIYLRGNTGSLFSFSAHDVKTGRMLWAYTDKEPTVSNIVESGKRLFVATPSKVVSLDLKTGRQVFASPAAQTGQTFPVQLKRHGNRIIYIGELSIAGFDIHSGKRVFFEGMTPVSQEAHLDALDNWISVLETRIGKLSKAVWLGGSGGATNAFTRQAEISQNLSNQYADKANHFAWRANETYNLSAESDFWRSANLQNQAKIESAYSGAMAQLGFFFAMEGLKNAMLSGAIAKDQEKVIALDRTRKSILRAYAASEAGEYIYRPHVEGDSVGVALCHWPTGRRFFKPLSPVIKDASMRHLNNSTLWILIDVKHKIVYYHGLRIFPEEYQEKSRPKGTVSYGSYLIAEKLKID